MSTRRAWVGAAAAGAWLTTNPPGSGVKKNSTVWTTQGQPLFTELAAYNAGQRCAPAG